MAKFAHPEIAELTHQLTLSPRRLRRKQFQGVERLISLVEPERSYPFDFVCYHITDYRKRGADTGRSLEGKSLVRDLVLLAEEVSRKSNLSTSDLGEAYLTHQELAAELKVSTKTVRRWRYRGLLGLRVSFEDGVNRLAFCRSTVDRFVEQHAALVRRGSSFTQLSVPERKRIVERARVLVAERPMKLHAAARVIAEEIGRAVETVRYTLRRHDMAAGATALFSRHGEPSRCEREQGIWRCHRAGESVEAIAAAFDETPQKIATTLRVLQVRTWKQTPPEYIYHELFDAPNAEALILGIPEPAGEETTPQRIPRDLPPYLRSLYLTPLLNREQEHDLFRRYNFVKFLAARQLKSVGQGDPGQEKLDRLSALMGEVETLRQRIIRANLRLVVSIAKRHVNWSGQFFEVVSDGNMSLMRAVEKFDFARGTKFSTYASWAIIKNYARSIPEQHYRAARYVTGQDGLLDAAADHREETASPSDREKVRKLIEEGMRELPDRERDIVRDHFGLGDQDAPQTLEQIGQRYGVTKERIRQIEARALSKLRVLLSPSLVDNL